MPLLLSPFRSHTSLSLAHARAKRSTMHRAIAVALPCPLTTIVALLSNPSHQQLYHRHLFHPDPLAPLAELG